MPGSATQVVFALLVLHPFLTKDSKSLARFGCMHELSCWCLVWTSNWTKLISIHTTDRMIADAPHKLTADTETLPMSQ